MNLYKIRTRKEGRMAAMRPRVLLLNYVRVRLFINLSLDTRTSSESLAKMKDASITDLFLSRLRSKLDHIELH